MDNKQAIGRFKTIVAGLNKTFLHTKSESMKSTCSLEIETIDYAIKALEENDKLKAENERLKQRLFGYKDLEKRQELYAIKKGKIFTHKVFTLENRGHLLTSVEDDYVFDFLWTDIGEKIFLTKEEADNKLAELRGDK